MGNESVPPPGRLIMGVLWIRDKDLEIAQRRIETIFGPVHLRSRKVPFRQFTEYYHREMAGEIQRCLWSFDSRFHRGALVEAKLATNRIERSLAMSGKRTVNLDPGLLTLEALSLATTKPYYHRLYLAKGIYGELTLVYRKGGYEPLPWTYPDYSEGDAIAFFEKVRTGLLEEHRRKKGEVGV